MVKIWIIFILLISFPMVSAQTSVLDSYIETGLRNNLAFKQQQFSLEKSIRALEEARGMFFPSIGIEARYSRAGGGRQIEMPIGDLVNPVYMTLNEILQAVGQPPRFPTNIPNQEFPFLRKEEHETKVRLIQPIFQPAILYNYKLKSNLRQSKAAELEVFKDELILDIKRAYFNYLKTVRVVELYQKTALLLQENLRVSESLFQNNKATREVVYRAQAEIAELEQKQAEAEKNRTLAVAYFNFLLNQPFNTPIKTVSEEFLSFNYEPDLEQAQTQALNKRSEFTQLKSGIEAAKNGGRLAKTTFLPTITGVLDYGYQGEIYRFQENDDYWMASAVMSWNLFNGFQSKARLRQAQMERNQLETQLTELNLQIKLQVQSAWENLKVARFAIESAQKRVSSNGQSFKIVKKKYENGMAPQIEFLDARTQLTNAEIYLIVTQYDYQIKYAEFRRMTGG